MNVSPEPGEIVQEEEEYDPARPISVTVCGPTETRELPAVRAGYRTEQSVTTTVGAKLLPFEPRRKSALVMAISQDVYLSGTQAGAQSGAAGAIRIPALIPWPINNLDEVWATAVSSTTDITIMAEYWSE